MSRFMITTVYDEVLHKIETMSVGDIDFKALNDVHILKTSMLFKDSRKGQLKITVINDKAINSEREKLETTQLTPEQQRVFNRQTIIKHFFLSAQDVILYRILLSHYINNQVKGVAVIKLDEIHKTYRNKAFKYEKGQDKYDKETILAYARALVKLGNIMVILDFSNSNLIAAKNYKSNDKRFVKSKLLEIDKRINMKNITTTPIRYSLGAVGDYFVATKQYGQLLPDEIYSLRFNQIDTFNMAIYIIRMIVINKRWHKDIKIFASTLLSKIMKYDRGGYNTLLNYLDYLERIAAVKRSKKIKQLQKQLDYILLLLKEKEIIIDYKYHGKFQYKAIRDNELYVVIEIGKKDKGK